MGNLKLAIKDIKTQHKKKQKSYLNETGKNSKIIYNCNICKDSGVVIIDKTSAKQCECIIESAKKAKIEKLIDFAQIPENFKNLRLLDFKIDVYKDKENIESILAIVTRFIKKYNSVQDTGKGLYFFSHTSGSGKTRLAITIANEVINLFNITVRYTTVKEVVDNIQGTFNKNSIISNIQIIDGLKNVDLLILDDLGVENITKWSESIIYSIIDYRVENKKINLITSNNSIDDLMYHDRVKSRIKKSSLELKFPEESVRDIESKKLDSKLLNILFID